jgi:hypothetical protein
MKANNQNNPKTPERKGNDIPKENPGQKSDGDESLLYPHERELDEQVSGNDASYSEQADVTPPKPHEFPSFGNATTDFKPSNHGRTTGRMIGHEPGIDNAV